MTAVIKRTVALLIALTLVVCVFAASPVSAAEATAPVRPTFVIAVKTSRRAVAVSWNAKGATGAEVWMKKGKSGTWIKKVTVTGSNIAAIGGLDKNGVYWFKTRSFVQTAAGAVTYSEFSAAARKTMKLSSKKPAGTYKKGSVYGPRLPQKKLDELRKAVGRFRDNIIESNMSDEEKLWLIYKYLNNNVTYAADWSKHYANTAWGALVYKQAQCSGYARAVKAMCDALKIDCYYVHASKTASNPEHQWNIVKIKGKWYIFDAQAGIILISGRSYSYMTGLKWSSKLPKTADTDYSLGSDWG